MTRGRPRNAAASTSAKPLSPEKSGEEEDETTSPTGILNKAYKATRGAPAAGSPPQTRAKGKGKKVPTEGEEVEEEEEVVEVNELGEPFSPTSTKERDERRKERRGAEEEWDSRFAAWKTEHGAASAQGPQDDGDEPELGPQDEELLDDHQPGGQPSSPITQHQSRRKVKATPPVRTRSIRIASRERDKGPRVRQREPSTPNPKTPKPPTKKSKKDAKVTTISLEDADVAVATAAPPKRKPGRRVSFSMPGPQLTSSPPIAPISSPYDEQFPPLSPSGSLRGYSPWSPANTSRGYDNASTEDPVDFDPATGKIALIREQLARLIKSASTGRMEKQMKGGEDSSLGAFPISTTFLTSIPQRVSPARLKGASLKAEASDLTVPTRRREGCAAGASETRQTRASVPKRPGPRA
ncbi:hypothetical protein DFH09DRAFT_1335757 [Mycena vulgaris]|nr:hypothetical protein DFH09DRAFT_1335757 [Mycena vulgaris]